MTSQYDIESGISKMNKLRYDFGELDSKKDKSKLDKKKCIKLAKELSQMEFKVGGWCEKFDMAIKPLQSMPECIRPDKIFVARIPKQEKDHLKYLKQYEQFILEENYNVNCIDKQTGYLIDVYSFFVIKA